MFVKPLKRRVLVNQFQYRLVVGNLMYLASLVLVFFVVLFGPIAAVLADRSVSLAQREVAAHQMLTLHERVWFAVPALIALCILHSVVISHRIAGPLHRFKLVLNELARGDLSVKVNIRRHDYLRQEAVIMARTVESLGERIRAIQQGHQLASETLPQLVQAVGRGADSDAAVLAGKLGTQMDALGRQIRQFNIDAPSPQTDSAATAVRGELAGKA